MDISFSQTKVKSQTNTLTLIHYLILILFISFAFFYGISSYVISDLNEGLYVEIAREMFKTHNYIIPHLNYVPYLEKPPLLYWLIALSDKIFGVSTFAARLIPALNAALTCLMLVFVGNKINHFKAGWYAGILLSTSLGFNLLAHNIQFDMLLIAAVTIGILLFYLWYHFDYKHYLLSAYAAVAISVLAKGLIGVILCGSTAIIFMLLMKTPWTKIKQFFDPMGILIFLLVTLPWHIAATIQLPSFTWDYFINEQWYRFLNERFPHDYHTGPIYYYVPRIFIYLFPWSLLIPTLVGRIHGNIAQQNPLKVLLWTWFIFSFVFFSMSGSKGDSYMLIAAPALALLMGLQIPEYKNGKILYCLWVISCAILCFGGVATYYLHIAPSSMTSLLLLFLSYLFIYFLIGLLLIGPSSKPVIIFLYIASLMFPLIPFYISLKHTIENNYTEIVLAQYIHSHDKSRQVYLYKDYEDISSIVFFLDKRLTIVDSKSNDLYFGSQNPEAKHWFINSNNFKDIAKNQKVYVVTRNINTLNFLQHLWPIPFCIVDKTDKTSLLSNDINECRKISPIYDI